MPGFVIEYSRSTGNCEVTPYLQDNGADLAFEDRMTREATNRDPDVEIVSVIAPSLDDVQRTHSRYFVRMNHARVA